MSSATLIYPVSPKGIDASVTETSSGFKKEVTKVMSSIIVFFIVYIILILLAVGLAMGCVAGGIWLIVAAPRIFMLMVGGGLIGLGLMVVFFLIKFIFAVNRFDHSSSILITEKDQPKLFAFIRKLTAETQTAFPKKIYISPEVNACVFYDSSFWSMFLPVKKNLQIGLGLVNSLTLDEFKAVMAHEFGHFSQRSMKLGSFVYNVNRVIYNMLYENNGYGRTLQQWANINGYFAFFAGLTAKIVGGIQWVLKKMYSIINKNYMSLSREMEFHADAVAASVSGSNNLISALRRLEIANTSYAVVLNKYDDWLKEKYIGNNIYPDQRIVLKQIAEEYKLEIRNDFPLVNDDFLNSNNLSRINFKDQWASHPTLKERTDHLLKLKVEAEQGAEQAWVIFENREELQKLVTQKVYQSVEIPEDARRIDVSDFELRYRREVSLYSFPNEYKGFYDGRQINLLNIEELTTQPADFRLPESFEELFTDEHGNLDKQIKAIAADIELLKAIAAGETYIKSFDFDGKKYDRRMASTLAEDFQKELNEKEQLLINLDKAAFVYFHKRAQVAGEEKAVSIKKSYTRYFALRADSDIYLKEINTLMELVQPFYAGQSLTYDNVSYIVGQLKGSDESKFKKALEKWIEAGVFESNTEFISKAKKFIGSDYAYFSEQTIFNNELSELNELIHESWGMIYEFQFKQIKKLTEEQLRY